VFWFSLPLLSVTFLILRTERDMIKTHINLHVQHLLYVSDFNVTWIFFYRVSKNSQISNFMKIRRVTADLSHADGRAEAQRAMTNLRVAFRNISKVLKIKNTSMRRVRTPLCWMRASALQAEIKTAENKLCFIHFRIKISAHTTDWRSFCPQI